MHDNIAYGVKLIQQYYRDGRNQGKSVNDALRYAGRQARIHGSSAYGDRFLTVALKWKARVGSADCTYPPSSCREWLPGSGPQP
jgi:hypothetical protein